MDKNTLIDTYYHSNLIITSEAFGVLRKALFDYVGKERASAFLLRFGKVLGENKAKELIDLQKTINDNNDLENLIKKVTQTHIDLGHVSDITSAFVTNTDYESYNTFDINGLFGSKPIKFNNVIGKWIDSFEVKLHLAHFGISDECSCYTLSGYASGIISAILNIEIFVKEVTCRSKGDADCTFEVHTKEYWEQKSPENLTIYDNQSILSEIEGTYDKLFMQNKLLERITNFHVELTDCILQQNNIVEVLKTAYHILKIPIVIQDLNGKVISSCGISEDDFTILINKRRILKERKNRSVIEEVNDTKLMSTPIYMDEKALVTCYFLYKDILSYDSNDYLFLERLSTVSTLCFLNEKISFETTERLKISILDRLILKQYSTIDEIISQLKFITPEITEPYITLMVDCYPKDITSPVDLYEKILKLSNVLQLYSLNGLLSKYEDKVVVLIFSANNKLYQKRVKEILSHLQKTDKECDYKIGVSNIYDDLNHFRNSLKQAEQAVNLPRPESIIHFDDLGLLGTFLQGININDLKNTAEKKLGQLLEQDFRNTELLYTLYIYLLNGGKLEKTMKDLSLSIGGIQYRIRKIEDILEVDLKDFKNASYLLLLIESLISIGEINFK